jgi:radical SAM superfamily enzyme YgiQ (UPF0313 family)
MGCIVTGYSMIKRLAAQIRTIHKRCTIVVGNSVATSIVDTLLRRTEADIAVMGEGDVTMVELLAALRDKTSLGDVKGLAYLEGDTIITTEDRPYIKDISTLPLLNFGLFDIDVYIDNSSISANEPLPIPREQVRALPCNTARGCIGKCTFCYHNFQGLPYRYRTARSIVDEIRHTLKTYNINYINFWDELTFYSKPQTAELIDLILSERLEFFWSASCRGNLFTEEQDMDLLRKMKQAGCLSMGYALESSDQRILRMMNKNVSVDDFAKQTVLLQRAGIVTYTSLVIGYPMETRETIRKTFECCLEHKIYPSAGFLLPQPGSGMYDYARTHGFIPDEEDYLLKLGDRQDLRLNMTAIPDDELEAIVQEGLDRCNQELGIGLPAEELMKTPHYMAPQDVKADS